MCFTLQRLPSKLKDLDLVTRLGTFASCELITSVDQSAAVELRYPKKNSCHFAHLGLYHSIKSIDTSDCWLVRMLGKWIFGRFPWIFIFYTRNEAHKQYSLLDTIFNYIFCLGPPGKYLYLSPKNPLHVGRRSRRTCSGFSILVYRYFPGGPRKKI